MMSSKVVSTIKRFFQGGFFPFLYLAVGIESFGLTFHPCGRHRCQLQQHRIPAHKIHSFSGRPYSSVCYKTTSTSSRTTSSLFSANSIASALKSSNSFILSALLIVSSCGLAIEKKSTVGKALSAPLVTMLLSLCLANIGAMPFESPIYHLVNRYLVPLAVPLFLFDSDLKRVVRDAGSLLVAFLIGAFSTVIGTLVAFTLIPLKTLGGNGWKVACALTARHIGGAINFVAVAETLNIDGGIVSSAIAADNVVVALYFAFLFYLATADDANTPSHDLETKSTSKSSPSAKLLDKEKVTTSSIAYSVATASCLVTVGSAITESLCPTISSLLITSVLTVVSATLFPSMFERLRSSGTAIGTLFLQIFFAASGASGSIMLVLRQAPSLFLFSALQVAVHFLVLLGIGCGMRLDSNELLLASNANVGGPTTAAAMAKAKNWKTLVLPALLVGVFGYGTATALSLALGPILIRFSR